MDDLELLREYATRKSEEAFAALVKRHVDFVYSTSVRLVRDVHLAEEITQAVFLVLAKKAGKIPRGTVLPGWLYKTTRFTASHALRAKLRRERYEYQALQAMTPVIGPQQAWREIAPLLDEALAKLGEAERNSILLRYIEKKPFREVARALGISEDAAKKRTARALEKLRTHFAKRQVVWPTTAIIAALSNCAVEAAPAKLASAILASAAASAVTAPLAVTLAEQTLKLMGWSKANSVAASGIAAVTAVASATLVFFNASHSTPTPPPGRPLEQPPPQVVASIQPTSPAPSLDWRELESSDDATYLANLRKAGVPEEIVRAVIADRLGRAHIAKMQRGPYRFWTPNSAGAATNIAKAVRYAQAYKEYRDALAQLDLPVPVINPSAVEFEGQRRVHAYLSPEKFEAFMEIEDKFAHLEQASSQQSKDLGLTEDEAERRSFKAQKREAIAALLTPEELEQYDLRTSQLSHRLRSNLDTFQPTEEEFVKIFRVLSKAEPELGGSFNSLVSGDGPAGKRLDDAKQRLDDELKAELGADRFLAYTKKRDTSYRGLENLAQRFALPGEVVDALHLIHTEAVRTKAQYRYDANIPNPLRQQGWQTAQSNFVDQVRSYLDEEAFKAYQNSRLGSWLEGPYDKY